ncbi:MAG: cytochrome P450 [Pseudonocardiaceae bacterium]
MAAASTVADLPYTRQVLNESLRLYPPFWEVLRSSYEADEIGGYEIPAGAPVLLCPFVTHRLPHLWDDPEAFRPERFGPNAPAVHRYGYRLDERNIAGLITTYREGATAASLATAHGLSLKSVKRLLHIAGVHRTSPTQRATTATPAATHP